MEEQFYHLFQLIIVGNAGVGKTSVLLRYAGDEFSEKYNDTIGLDFKVIRLNIEGKAVRLNIWDTAGQERFRNITQSYYRGVKGIVVMYDVTDLYSFECVRNWVEEIKSCAEESIPILLIGNKSDRSDRAVSTDAGLELAESLGIQFIETSAKYATNVKVAFETLARILIRKLYSKSTVLIHQPNKVPAEIKMQARYCCS